MKKIAIILSIAINTGMAYAQTSDEFWAEEFIAEAYYDNLTENSPKVYLNKEAYYEAGGFDHWEVLSFFQSLIPDFSETEMREAFTRNENRAGAWNENAPVFRQLKYKNLIFVDDIFRLSKRKQKRAELRGFGKPLFIRNGEYAFVIEHHGLFYGCSGWNWKKPWKSFRCGIRMYFLTEDYGKLYRKVNGKWLYIDRILIASGHY